jgi:hypothetical protein
VLVARASRFLTTVVRHAVPINGVFASDWHPATAITVYWVESVLLALATAGLCALFARRTPAVEIRNAGIEPGSVLAFHVGSLMVFGAFLGGILLIMIGNGHFDEPMRWPEIRSGVELMLVVVGVGLVIDLWGFDRFTVASMRSRVDACTVRWALFWLLGFFGTFIIGITGQAVLFFGFFAALKVTFESWATLARVFGWRSLQDRAATAPAAPTPDRT